MDSTTESASESSTEQDAAEEDAEALPTLAQVKALCPMFTGSTAMTAAEFCVAFVDVCLPLGQPAVETLKDEGSCQEFAYPGWANTAGKQNCVSEYVCRAVTGNGNINSNCQEAQGFGNVCPM